MNTSHSILDNAYAPYAARLSRNTHLPGLLRFSHFVNGFSQICRESGRVLMYVGTYIRIKADDGMIWWLQQPMMG